MKKTSKIFVALSLAAVPLVAGSVIFGATNNYFNRTFAENVAPKDVVLELTANDLSSGSGSVVLNGNAFNYEGITISGNNIVLASGARIVAAQESGASDGADGLKGAGYNYVEVVGAADGSANVTINSAAHTLPVTTGETVGMAIASDGFEMQVTGGSIIVSVLRIKYSCKLVEPVIDGKLDDAIWTSTVLNNKMAVNYNASNKTDVYATKTADGIYIFAEQHVSEIRNVGDGWWQHDNIEFRIGSQFHAPREDRDQYWMSALKTSNMPHFAVTDLVHNEVTNLYDINYEAFFSWSELGYVYEDDIVIASGIAYQAGWAAGPGWYSVRLDNYKTITPSGFGTFSYDKVRSGVETVTTPVSESGTGWKSTVAQITMDGSKNWGIKVSYRSTNDPAGTDPNAKGAVGEIFSPSWANGGWTFRKDWWGWGSWSFAHDNTGTTGGAAKAGFCDLDEMGNDHWVAACCDIDVVEYVAFNAALGRLTITAVYTSKVTEYLGQKLYIEYSSNNFDWRGDMIVSYGYDTGTFTLNGLEVLTGTKVSQTY